MNIFYLIVFVLTSSTISAIHLPIELLQRFPALAQDAFALEDDKKTEQERSSEHAELGAAPKINASLLQLVLPASVAKRKFACTHPACSTEFEYAADAQNNGAFVALGNFVDHIKSHAEFAKPKAEINSRIILCPNDGCAFGSSIRRLIAKHKKECRFKSVDPQIQNPQFNKCPRCPRTFTTPHELVVHRAYNICDSKHVCTYEGCNEAFFALRTLNEHKKAHENKTQHRLFCSNNCGFASNYLTALRAHIRKNRCKGPKEGQFDFRTYIPKSS